jgi:hypothetical protein
LHGGLEQNRKLDDEKGFIIKQNFAKNSDTKAGKTTWLGEMPSKPKVDHIGNFRAFTANGDCQ